MTPPKFSVGERVVFVPKYVLDHPDAGKVYTIVAPPEEIFGHRQYRVDDGSAIWEESLRPLPPEKKSTWDDFEEEVGWRPVEVVV